MTTDVEETTLHAPLAPSSSARWMACPGSIAAELKVKEESGWVDDSNEHSRLGTAAHALLETCMLFGFDPEELIGMRLAGPDHPAVDDSMIAAVQQALDYVNEYIEDHGRENLIIYVENRVQIGERIGIADEQCNGTGDIIIAHRDGSVCVIFDYKHGLNRVDAKENSQLMLYALGAGRLRADKRFRKYQLVIGQPRAAKRRAVDEWTIPHGRLLTWAINQAKPAAQAALRPDAPRSAGTHCRWCRAAPTCRTYRAKVRAVAAAEFDAIPDEPDPESISIEEYSEILSEAEMIESWLKSVRGHALRVMQNGQEIPGFKLGWGVRRRVWDDETGIVEYCTRKKLDTDDFHPRKLLSPAKMATLFRQNKIILRKKTGEEPPPNPLDAFIRYSVPKARIARVDESEFDTIDEDDEEPDDE